MKNLLRTFALVAMSFLAFSCSQEEAQDLDSTSITKLVAAGESDFSYFSEALVLTGMDAMLDEPGSYTVLVPNDDAFLAVLGGLTIQEFIDANPAGTLEAVLRNHIIDAEVVSADLSDGQTVTTSLGQTLTVSFEDNAFFPDYDEDLGGFEETSVFFNSARVYARDAKASNGVIHVINAVLMPTIGG